MVTQLLRTMELLMKTEPTPESPGDGLELDKLEIPKRSPSIQKSTQKTDSPEKSFRSSEKSRSGKRHLRLPAATVITTLVFIVAAGIFFNRGDLTLGYLSREADSVQESLLRIGPVTATMANNDIIRLTLDIDCGEASLKQKLSEKDSLIQDKIISVLTDPETEALLEEQEFDAVRTMIKTSLYGIDDSSIDEVYFVELLTY